MEARGRMYYEAAWAWRTLADRDIAGAKMALQVDKQKQLQAVADKKARRPKRLQFRSPMSLVPRCRCRGRKETPEMPIKF